MIEHIKCSTPDFAKENAKKGQKAYKNQDNDPRGPHRDLACWARGTQGGVKYSFTSKDGTFFPERLWLFSKQNLEKMDLDGSLLSPHRHQLVPPCRGAG